jgi:hypothetical protein
VKTGALLALFAACSAPAATPDAGRPPFCPMTGADLCADFESTADPGAGWTGMSIHGAAKGSVEARSFVVTVPPSATTVSSYAPYWETTAPLEEARIQLAVHVEMLPAILTIAVILYPQDDYAAALQIAQGNLYIVERHAGVADSPYWVGRIGVGDWHGYELVVSPQRRKLEARVDGNLSSFGMAASQTFKLLGKKMMSVGVVDSSATLPSTFVRFDDVALFSR